MTEEAFEMSLLQLKGVLKFLLVAHFVLSDIECRYPRQYPHYPSSQEYLKEYIRQSNPYENNHYRQCIDLTLLIRDIPIEPSTYNYFVELATQIHASKKYFNDLLVAGDVVILGIGKSNFKTHPLSPDLVDPVESTCKINILLALLDNYFNVQKWELPRYNYPVFADCTLATERFEEQAKSCNYNNYYELMGACHNPKLPGAGSQNREYRRLTQPFCTLSGERNHCELPSARKVSLTIQSALNHPEEAPFNPYELNDDLIVSSFALMYLQIHAHDVAYARVKSSDRGQLGHAGCTIDQRKPLDVAIVSSRSAAISVDCTDPFYGHYNVSCLNFVRVETVNEDCRLRKSGALNQATPLLDLDNIYERNTYPARAFIEAADGDILLDHHGVPIIADERSRQHIGIVAANYFFTKLHNLIANEIRCKFASTGSEVFRIARSINIAIYQHIFYDYVLSSLIGESEVLENQLHSDEDTFDEFQDPEILSEYACAAGRACHKFIPDELLLLDPAFNLESTIPLKQTFYMPDVNEEFIRKIGQGLYIQQWKHNGYSDQITNHLFHDRHLHYGTDLLSYDIQRGRDCCLKPYVHYLNIFFGTCISSWEDLKEHIPSELIYWLQLQYTDVKDIELLAGAQLEPAYQDSSFGKVITKLHIEQYRRLKSGDAKFWTRTLTQQQQNQIRRLSMSDLLCIVFGYDQVPENGVYGWSNSNPLVQCRCRTLAECLDVTPFCSPYAKK